MFEIDLFCSHCGKKVLLDSDIYQVTIKGEAWQKAQAHLFDVIVSHFENNLTRIVSEKLIPLKKRFDQGERTHELYKAIMDEE